MKYKLPAALYRYEIQQLVKKEQAETVVEIGIYCADLSRLLVPIKTLKTLFLIDPWKIYTDCKKLIFTEKDAELLYNSVYSWSQVSTVKNKVKLMRMSSIEASKHFEDNSIDFIHIDGDHTYNAVKVDIKAWLPKLKPGKLLTGDDYQSSEVSSAVNKLLSKIEVIKNKIWIFRKLN